MSKAQNILNLNPSLVLIPSTGKTGELDSIIPSDGSGDFTVTRNGNATYFDKDGILKTALPNQPRFDFDPLTGQFRGVLVEPAATNVLLNSETPATQTRLMTAAQRTISFYGSGTVTLSGAFSATITGNANPLIRTTFTFTPTNTNLTITPSGNVTRWQLELGSVATSYIPTSGSQVTRPADIIQRTNAQDLIGQEEGSLYAELNLSNITFNFFRAIFGIGSYSNGFHLLIDNPNANSQVFTFFGRLDNINLFSPISSSNLTSSSFGRFKLLGSYKSNEYKFFINGVLIGTRTGIYSGAVLNVITLNLPTGLSGGQASQLRDSIRCVSLFKTALTDAQAIALTTL